MNLSAQTIKTFNSVNSFVYGDWAINANEPQTLYFQLVDKDQKPYPCRNDVVWPGIVVPSEQNNFLRYLTGIGSVSPVIVTVTFPSLNCSTSPLTITATQVDSNDSSLFKVVLTYLQVPGSGNVLFSVQEGTVTRRFYVQDAISVTDPTSLGQC